MCPLGTFRANGTPKRRDGVDRRLHGEKRVRFRLGHEHETASCHPAAAIAMPANSAGVLGRWDVEAKSEAEAQVLRMSRAAEYRRGSCRLCCGLP
jgi:hypothetical protein